MTFESLANQLHNERISNLVNRHKERVLLGEDIYTNFCVWCNGYAKQTDKTNANIFAQWLKNNNITLTFWQRKNIAENHFGWEFTWKEDIKDWEIKKV